MEVVSTDPEMLPVLVVGYPLPGVDGYASRDPLADFPALRALEPRAPIHVFEHQFGGASCLQAQVVGVAFPLASNLGALLPGADRLVRALRDLGESRGPSGSSPELALLEAWRDSQGWELTEPDLREMEALLRRYIPDLPTLERGWEALLISVPVPSLRAFGGWHAIASHPPDEERVDARLAEQLHALGRALGLESPVPQVFLLWESSD